MTSPEAAKPFLGRYELQRKIAVGGMAELYLAQVRGVGGFQKQVVVKRILPQLAESEELFNMFMDEARIAATLQHPNVVQVYDACEENGEYFMAMEYLDGTDLRTLRKVLADRALPLPWEHALHIVVSICSGLHYAHDKRGFDGAPLGIVHRDVTPHNIFLTREGGAKLVDFGIAKAQGRKTETAMGTLKGKLAYMSPEQCVGDPIDRRSDIYSLGIILYELTTGKRLYKGSTEYQLIKEIVEGEIKPPSSFMEFPQELEDIVLKCLAKSPGERFQSAREIQSALEGFAREYHLMFSSLSFSAFLEPLLEQASAAAEARWKQRKGAMPIRIGNSAAPVAPAAAPARSPAPPPASSNAEQVIESFLGASSGAAAHPSLRPAAPRPASRPAPRPASRPASPRPALPSMASLASMSQGGIEVVDEPMTARVPEDMLARLREEEKELAAKEAERDAVPRLARGSSISTNVLRRGSSPGVIVGKDDVLDSRADAEQLPEPTTSPADFRESSQGDAQIVWETPKRAPSARRLQATALVDPLPPSYSELSEIDLRVTRSSGGLWIAALLFAGLAGAAGYWYTQQEAEPPTPSVAAPAKPLVGSLLVTGAEGAEVWLFLGRTPINAMAVNGEAQHRIRVEHEGYQSVERALGPRTWQRDANGNQFAAADLKLLPLGQEAATATDEEPATSDTPRPANLRLSSTPSAANAWLYVGTTPEVQVGNLPTDAEVQLRVEAEGQRPIFRVVQPEEFDTEGKARIAIALPESPPVATLQPASEAEPAKPTATQPKAAKSPRPTAGKQLRRATKPASAAPARANKARGKARAMRKPLEHPTPAWAK